MVSDSEGIIHLIARNVRSKDSSLAQGSRTIAAQIVAMRILKATGFLYVG